MNKLCVLRDRGKLWVDVVDVGLVPSSSYLYHLGICNEDFTFLDTSMSVNYTRQKEFPTKCFSILISFKSTYHARRTLIPKHNLNFNSIYNGIDPNNNWSIQKLSHFETHTIYQYFDRHYNFDTHGSIL